MQYHQSESHHKELAACTDEQLCAMAATGDREAEELLVTRYYGMCARVRVRFSSPAATGRI